MTLLITFSVFLALFFIIGMASYRFAQKTTADYLVAGKNLHPALVGLSAVATNNSGYMFIGMIGTTYFMGLSSIWIMLGWIAGDWIAQRKTVHAIQTHSQPEQVHSFGGLISQWVDAPNPHRLRQLVGLLTLLFLTLYAAAQLKAGTKATEALLGWQPETGILVAAVIIFAYSFSGGLRASIWTDAAQSVVMLLGMLAMLYFALQTSGGVTAAMTQLTLVSEDYMNWFPSDLGGASVLAFIIGWLFGGMGVIGQPQIVIRFMTLNPKHSPKTMQFYYYLWFTTFYSLTLAVGLLSRLILTDSDVFDAEMALPLMATQLMPELFTGLLMAALFAATMSTVDSLVLSCSAAVTRDLSNTPVNNLRWAKLATLGVLVLATGIALSSNQSVFALVLDAWGLLGSAFAPLLLGLSLNLKITQKTAIITILSGISVFILFSQTGWLSFIYPITFGMLGGILALAITTRLRKTPANKTTPNQT